MFVFLSGKSLKFLLSTLTVILFFYSSVGFSQKSETTSQPKSILSEQDYLKSGQWNEQLQRRERGNRSSESRPLRPATDHDEFHYFLMSAEFSFDSKDMKQKIAQNLPSRMKLVLLTHPGKERSAIRDFSQWIDRSRIIVATHRTAGNGFWSRDSFPFPVYLDSSLKTGLVAAKYDRDFSAHSEIAKSAGAGHLMRQKNFIFVGGNLLADEQGRCFVVDSRRLFRLQDETIRDAYGCSEVHRLKHLSGIGDVDEVIKLLPNMRAITTRNEYKSLLEGLGYQVFKLPELSRYRTYANSVLVDDMVFMPAFNISEDDVAAAVYEQLGYRVIRVQSTTISTSGLGSVHCATMAYPKIDSEILLRALGAKKFDFEFAN